MLAALTESTVQTGRWPGELCTWLLHRGSERGARVRPWGYNSRLPSLVRCLPLIGLHRHCPYELRRPSGPECRLVGARGPHRCFSTRSSHIRVSVTGSEAQLPLHIWADEIRSIAYETRFWARDDPYVAQRSQRLIRIAAEIAGAHDVRDVDEIEKLYDGDLVHLTPYSGGDAAIFNDGGRILLIQRKDDGLWAMPGGILEVGEMPAEGSCREARKETGLEVDAVMLSGVYDSRLCGTQSAHHLYQFVFLCRLRTGDSSPQLSNETLGVGWYRRDELPRTFTRPRRSD